MSSFWKKLTTLALALLMALSCFAFIACEPQPEEPEKKPEQSQETKLPITDPIDTPFADVELGK